MRIFPVFVWGRLGALWYEIQVLLGRGRPQDSSDREGEPQRKGSPSAFPAKLIKS